MKQLHEIITGLLHSRGLWNEYQISKLIHNWGIMVGEPLSGVTRAKDFSRGRLRILVQDPVWGHHLSLMKPRIIERLNTQLGSGLVKEIYFQVGEISTGRQAVNSRGNQPPVEEAPDLEFKRNLRRLRDLTVSR